MAQKPKQTITIHDVAKEAKVSIATVSRVINGNDKVSEKLEKRVRKAMKKLNYHRSSLARGLKVQETRLIGLVIPLIDHPFFSRLAQVMEQALFHSNYRAIICNTEANEAQEREYIDLLLQQRVDGVILNSSLANTEYLFQLSEQNVPTVLIDGDVEDFVCSKVFSDNSMGGYQGMEHLYKLGHRHIKVIAPFVYAPPMQQRMRGVREAMADYGIPDNGDVFIEMDDPSFEAGVQIGRWLGESAQPPTAIYALTDVTGVGVMQGLWQAGLRVPEDMSVMGYDGIPLSEYVTPQLSTVAQPIKDMGLKAVEILLKQIKDPDLPQDRVVL
ncbi:MAG: LacI family DNA-binding transcriptional regulator, partial [Chloroflexota bacterium]